MPPAFASDSPLVQAIKRILQPMMEGLAIPEIRRALIKAGRPGVRETDIQQIVRLPDFRQLANGRIILAENEPPATPEAQLADDLEHLNETPPEPSTLRDLTSLNSYVVFDVETNGRDPETSDFFQLSAIKILNGQAAASFNAYARLDTGVITCALRKKLHFEELDLEHKIAAAGTQDEAVGEFLEFAGDLPLVAHNSGFDIGFLRKSNPEIANPVVDALELAVLAWPISRSHRLESLAKDLGLNESGAHWEDVLALDTQLNISADLERAPGDLFHSAIFDCLILHLVLQAALVKLRGLPPQQLICFRSVASSLGELIGAPSLPDTPPQSLQDILHLSADASEKRLPSIPFLQYDLDTTQQVYDRFLKRTGWRKRNAQQEMLRSVTTHLNSSTYEMIEAPTGTGKTLAYLIPALVLARSTGSQVIVSTSTRALQDQILSDLQNRISGNLSTDFCEIDFRFAVLKGQENYLCLTKLWNIWREAIYETASASVSFEEKLCLLYLLRYAAETPDGDLQNTSYWLQSRFPVLAYFKTRLSSELGVCGPTCEYKENCFYQKARTRAEQADLLVVNHNLLLLYKKDESEAAPLHLVLDEAHNLEDAVTTAYTEEASREKIEHLLKRLVEPNGKRGLLLMARTAENADKVTHCIQSIRRVRRRVREFGGYLREFVKHQGISFHNQYGANWRMRVAPWYADRHGWTRVSAAMQEIIDEFVEISRAIGAITAPYAGLEKKPSYINELEVVYAALLDAKKTDSQFALLQEIPKVVYDPLVRVHWIELGIQGQHSDELIMPENIVWAFKRAPVRVNEILEDALYKRVASMVMTSATLYLGEGGFNFFTDRLGLKDRETPVELVKMPIEFNYAEQVMLGMPGYLHTSAAYEEIERFKKEMAQELTCLFTFTEGRGLVLHTARSRMEYVARHLEKSLSNLPVYYQQTGISSRLLKEDFEANEESILLGVRSFWEGIDVPGPSLSYLVIEKLPFPSPTEPITAARCDQIRSVNGNEWGSYLIPLAALHFKQGFGRLMRKDDDRGVVLFMDKRLRSGAMYREAVLGSLPGYKRTDDTIEAEEDRANFYRAIAEHMQSHQPFSEGGWESRLDLLTCIREEALPEIQKHLAELELPLRIPVDEFSQYLGRLEAAASLIINGFTAFHPQQIEAMQAMLAGQDTLVVLPTGSGKSLTFQLPALLRNGVTLVFSPLIALMRDQVERLRNLGLTQVDYIVSGQSSAHRDEVYRRMQKGELRLVYISPERIRDTALVEALKHTNVIQAVVDEAHCVHMWGPSFRPDFLSIPSLFAEKRPPFAALTATATSDTRKAIAKSLQLSPDLALITKSVDRPELKFIVYNQNSAPERISSKKDKLRVLVKILRAAQQNDEVAIVYTSTVRDAEYLSRLLDLNGFSVRHYHGRMNAQQRQDVEEEFREGIIKIIIATKAFGMGIDKSDVRYVIHYDIPGDLESYFQEAGRGGRDGQNAYCVLLYHKSDLNTQKYFIQKAFPTEEELNRLLQVIREHANGSDRALIRPDDLAEASGIDPEKLDVALHLVQQMGFIRRSYNFTVKANAILNHSPEWIGERLPEDQKQLLNNLTRTVGLSNLTGTLLDLPAISDRTGLSPIIVDIFLTQLSARGWAVYRPWDRGYILETTEDLLSGKQAYLTDTEVRTFRASMMHNLDLMINYAEVLGDGDCLRSYILKYFGERLEAHPSPCCNLCHTGMPVPWQGIPFEEYHDLSSALNPEYIILRAVQWNEELSAKGRTSPYTTRTLVYILKGNTYAATQYETDPVQRARRAQRMESSPYFGILTDLRGGEKAINEIFNQLSIRGYLGLSQYQFTNDQKRTVMYDAPCLTSKGIDQILSGKLILAG